MKLSWSHKLFLKINAEVGKRPRLDAFMIFCAKWLIFILVSVVFVNLWMNFPVEEIRFKIFSMVFLSLLIIVPLSISWLIAWFWRHPRPIIEIPETKELITPFSHWKTFPSDHTTVAFVVTFYYWWSVLTVGSFPRALIVLIMACLVAVSRVYVGVHYPRDIVGGIILAVCTYIGLFIIGLLGLLFSPTM